MVILLLIAAGLFWLISNRKNEVPTVDINVGDNNPTFNPLNPNGGTGSNNLPIRQASTTLSTNTSATKEPIVRLLVVDPVAAAISTSTSRGVVIRYIDRATGHIFEIGQDYTSPYRVTNTTIPKILGAKWSPNGSDALISYMRNDNEFVTDLYIHINEIFTKANASSTASTTPATGLLTTQTKVVGNGNQLTVLSPSGKKVFYLSGVGQILDGYISNPDGTSLSKVWRTPVSNWVADWVKEGASTKTDTGSKIALYVKPISIGTGFGYLFDPNTKGFDKVGQGGKGFTMKVNKSATYAITATTEGGRISTNFVNIKTNTSTIAPIRTLPEKCSWSTVSDKVIYCAVPDEVKTAQYPDAWYMGEISFSDTIWKTNIETGEVVKLANLFNETSDLIDAIDLSVAPGDIYVTFMNKEDLSLYMVKTSK